MHGGNGIAFVEWVKKWNNRGFAAIAMSLTGDGPAAIANETDLTPYRGQTCWGNAAFKADYENAAMYQNVINVIRAHNLLRVWPGVDRNKIGITGISWGGVTTTIVIGVDNRFKFAVPVYGSGYAYISETYFSSLFTSAENTTKWDPANFASRMVVPTLYVNGDSDPHFSLNTTSLTCGVTANSRMSIHHKYGHDYNNGWGAEEIYRFADGMIKGYEPFITITDAVAENGKMSIAYIAPDSVILDKATLYYITDSTLPYGGEVIWKSVSNYTNKNGIVTMDVPSEATFCYATLTDSNGSLISTKYLEVK